MPNEVEDKKAEVGIKLGNILSGAILAAILGVWKSLDDLQEKLGVVVAQQQVNVATITALDRRVTTLETIERERVRDTR